MPGKTRNILFSTTRQWNPGDEFVLRGCINLLRIMYGDFNPVIFNRSPEVRQEYSHLNILRKLNLHKFLSASRTLVFIDSFIRMISWDNSFKDHTNGEFLDLAVFAGTPEWTGSRLTRMYEIIDEFDLPTVFLGIGNTPEFTMGKLTGIFSKTLRNAGLVTARDKEAAEKLRQVNAHYLPCPALLAALGHEERHIETVNRIGLIFGHYGCIEHNNIAEDTYRFIEKLYDRIIGEWQHTYDVELVCHYIDELPQARRAFPQLEVRYSYDSRDYFDIYRNYDFLVGPRIHGIGIGASMGIPGIAIRHDFRGDAADGFLADKLEVGTDLEAAMGIIKRNIRSAANKSRLLLEHKRNTQRQYIVLLSEALRI